MKTIKLEFFFSYIKKELPFSFSEGNLILSKFNLISIFYSPELLTEIATSSGLEVLSLEYIQRETVNLKKGLSVPRIFIQGKFRKMRRKEEEKEAKDSH